MSSASARYDNASARCNRADRFRAIQISECARYAQYPVIAPCRQPHGLGRVTQQFLSLGIRLGDIFQDGGGCFGIGADVRQSQARIAGELDGTGRGNTRGDFSGAFRRWRQDEIGWR